MGLFGKKKDKENKTTIGAATQASSYKPPKEFKGTPEQMEWLKDNVLGRCGVKKIVYENADPIIQYIQRNFEYPLRDRLKGKSSPQLDFINKLLSDLAFFTDCQEIF